MYGRSITIGMRRRPQSGVQLLGNEHPNGGIDGQYESCPPRPTITRSLFRTIPFHPCHSNLGLLPAINDARWREEGIRVLIKVQSILDLDYKISFVHECKNHFILGQQQNSFPPEPIFVCLKWLKIIVST